MQRPGLLPGQLPVRGSQGRAAWDSWCIQGLIEGPGRRPKPSNCMHACGSKQPDDGQGGGGEEERKGGDFLAQPRQSVKLHTSLLPVLDSPPPSLPPPSRECWLPTTRPQDCHFGKENEALHPCCPSSLLLPLANLSSPLFPPSSSRLSPPMIHPTGCGNSWMPDTSSSNPSPKTGKLATNTHQIAPAMAKYKSSIVDIPAGADWPLCRASAQMDQWGLDAAWQLDGSWTGSRLARTGCPEVPGSSGRVGPVQCRQAANIDRRRAFCSKRCSVESGGLR